MGEVLIRCLTNATSCGNRPSLEWVMSRANSAAVPSACPSSSNTARHAKQPSALAAFPAARVADGGGYICGRPHLPPSPGTLSTLLH